MLRRRLLSCKKINCDTILDLIFGLICILLIKTADIFAILYFAASQVEYAEKYDLRPGMGLAYPQIGVAKRIFVIVDEVEKGKFENYVIINPKIVSQSEELIYVGEGEGCLSVNREVEGIVPRAARVTVEYNDYNGDTYRIRVREDIAVAFQHEIDHLDGILFVDKIDKKNPFKDKELMREI